MTRVVPVAHPEPLDDAALLGAYSQTVVSLGERVAPAVVNVETRGVCLAISSDTARFVATRLHRLLRRWPERGNNARSRPTRSSKLEHGTPGEDLSCS